VGVKVEDVKIHSGVRPESRRTSAVTPDRIGQLAVIGTAVAATLGLLPWLGNSMFADEGATLYSAHLSWSNLWAQSLHVDLVLLPYYVLVHFWVMLSGSMAWVRSLSLFAFFGTIVAAGGLGLRIAGRWCGIIAAVLTATSTLLILKALNARPYELSALLVALCAVSLFKWLDDARARWLWAFSFLAILATATQLFALLAPASMLICVLGVRPRLLAQRLRALLAPIVLFAVLSGTWIAASTGEVGQVNWIAQGSAGGQLLAELRGPALGQAYDLVIFVIVVLVVAKLAIIWDRGVRHAVAEQIRRDRDIFALTIGWAIVPTLALSIASFAHPIYANRYVTASAPGAALLVAFVVVRVFPATLDPARASIGTGHGRLRGRILAFIGVVAVIALATSYVSSASALQEDLQGSARYVAQHAQSGDVIALPDHAITAAIGYYLASYNRPVPLWPQLGVRQRYVEGFDLSPDPSSVSRFPRRVWVVTGGTGAGIEHFEGTLADDGYALSKERRFTGVTLSLFRLARSAATSVIAPPDGAIVSGNITLDAVLMDPTKLKHLVFQATGSSLHNAIIGTASATLGGWVAFWDSTKVANGFYHIRSVVVRPNGTRDFSSPILIHIENNPGGS
jgi:Protein of unknown function (DUF2723)